MQYIYLKIYIWSSINWLRWFEIFKIKCCQLKFNYVEKKIKADT